MNLICDVISESGEIGKENTFYQFDQLFDNAMEEIKNMTVNEGEILSTDFC